MSSIDLFAKESSISSFIQDVLSTVDYTVDVHESATIPNIISSIIIWDLDSFPQKNISALSELRSKAPDSMILAFASNTTDYESIPNKLYDQILSAEAIRFHLMSKISRLKEIHSAKQIFKERMSHLVGKSESMENLRKIVGRAIHHSGPVLIQGESGVGKDLIAKAIACMYDKFVVVNCSAIPESLFESELFGHTRGAFTGAQNERIGLFEDANGGAIFLDEIGDMPLHAQVKLLRVIQNQEIRPIGANKTRHIDVRIIAATNRDLKAAVQEKKFREDLYYRLNVIPVNVAPLRNRKEDIEDLANYFISQYAPEGEPYTLSPAALRKLQDHHWPGNIRELENVIQRALCFTDPGTLQPEDLTLDSIPKTTAISDRKFCENYEEFRNMQLEDEKQFLLNIIQENRNSVSKAATVLGMNRTALYNRLTRLGVVIKDL